MKYYPMQMHAHSCFQPGGSMEGHIYNAKKLGMEYIHITDHDVRFGRKAKNVDKFDFSKGLLEYNDYPNATIGLYPFGEGMVEAGLGTIKICYKNDDKKTQKAGLKLIASGKRQSLPLLSNVSITLGLKFTALKNARVVIDCALSQRPPEYKEAHLKYVFGNYEQEEYCKHVKLSKRQDDVYQLDVTKDCEDCEEIGGLDNAFSNVSFTIECENGGSAEIELFQLEFKHELDFQEVLDRQRILAKKIGEKYGVHPFVTYEISMAGQHKNVFSSNVPMFDYQRLSYNVTEEYAIQHIKKYNGTFSWNHAFDNNIYGDVDLDSVDVDELIKKEAERLTKNKVFGASLIEVGFYGGKRQFALKHYLKLWDLLSLNGVFITGEGNSDSHYNDRMWFDGQNCASWIGAPKDLPFPISEDVFNQSMRAGRVYFGNPVLLNFPVEFNSGKTQMGGIILTKDPKEERVLHFNASKAPLQSVVRIVINGECSKEIIINESKDAILDITLSANLPVNFARIELYDKQGNCVLMTNPIYLVRSDLFTEDLPSCRIYE